MTGAFLPHLLSCAPEFGASETFGLCQSPDFEFPRLIEKHRNELPSHGMVPCKALIYASPLSGIRLPRVLAESVYPKVDTRCTAYRELASTPQL